MLTTTLPITTLVAHASNSNTMPPDKFKKLTAHIARTCRYPPIIVRALPKRKKNDPQRYQILDGHHRVKALQATNHTEARCDVWDVDDHEALLLLATLNRLEGRDDPHQRAALVSQLRQHASLDDLSSRLPEAASELQQLMSLRDPLPAIRAPQKLDQMPVAVHFFLLPSQRRKLNKCLDLLGGTRENAIMQLVNQSQYTQQESS